MCLTHRVVNDTGEHYCGESSEIEDDKCKEYEKLVGDFSGCYSKRFNIQHRLIYQPYKNERIIKILSMWEHYE